MKRKRFRSFSDGGYAAAVRSSAQAVGNKLLGNINTACRCPMRTGCMGIRWTFIRVLICLGMR